MYRLSSTCGWSPGHPHGDRLRLRATLAYLNARVEPGLSVSRYGGRAVATRRGTDRRAALICVRSLVRDGGLPLVAKLDIASVFDAIPHGPLLVALRLPLTKMFFTTLARSLGRSAGRDAENRAN